MAVPLPATTRHDLLDATAALRDTAPDLAWITAPDKLHLTMKFLGDTDPARVEALCRALADVAQRERSFEVEIGEVGAFPNFRRARVVWLGVEREPRLELLHHDLEVACEALGFPIEGRAYRPHLTLARVRHRPDEEVLRALARAARRVDYRAALPVHSIELIESVPGPGGYTYRTIESFPLRTD